MACMKFSASYEMGLRELEAGGGTGLRAGVTRMLGGTTNYQAGDKQLSNRRNFPTTIVIWFRDLRHLGILSRARKLLQMTHRSRTSLSTTLVMTVAYLLAGKCSHRANGVHNRHFPKHFKGW